MGRVNGEIQPLDYPHFTPNVTRELIYDILSNDQRLENEWELDFSLPHLARFRVNVYVQNGA